MKSNGHHHLRTGPIFSPRLLFRSPSSSSLSFRPFSKTPNNFKPSSPIPFSSFSSTSSSPSSPPPRSPCDNLSPKGPREPRRMMPVIRSGLTFKFSIKNAITSSHCCFVCASSELRIWLSRFNFSFSPGKSANGLLDRGDDVDVEPMSSPELDGDELPAVTAFRRRISESSSSCPRLKFSFVNSHLSVLTLVWMLETNIYQREALIRHRNNEIARLVEMHVDPSSLEEMEGRMNATVVKAQQSREQNTKLSLELSELRARFQVLDEEKCHALDQVALLREALLGAGQRLSDFQSEVTRLVADLRLRLNP